MTVFVNPTSGGCKGLNYLKLASARHELTPLPNVRALVHIVNLFEDAEKREAYAAIHDRISQGPPP